MTPQQFLMVSGGVTLLAVVGHWAIRLRQRRRLRALSRQLRMQYISFDRFRIAPRLGSLLPIPGCSDVEVIDVIYGNATGGRHRYLFTVAYTAGVIRTKRRVVRVGALLEPVRGHDKPERFVLLDEPGCGPTAYQNALKQLDVEP